MVQLDEDMNDSVLKEESNSTNTSTSANEDADSDIYIYRDFELLI